MSKIKLKNGASYLDTEFEGSACIGDFTCITRSLVGKYFGIGCFSFLSDSVVQNYSTFGSRCSIGAFSHPTDYLSCHEVAFRNTINIYADTVIEDSSYPIRKKTLIGNDVWIGDNCVILTGVCISDGAVIAAGSVVTKDVPPYAIVAGNPAKIIKYRFDDKIIDKLLKLRWWNLDMKDLKDISFIDVNKSINTIEFLLDKFN